MVAAGCSTSPVVTADHYDARTSTVVSQMTLQVGATTSQRLVRHRVMTCREIVDILEGAGLAVETILGGLEDEPFAVGSARCLVVAARA